MVGRTLAAALMVLATTATAQTPEAITLDANDGIEWRRDAKVVVARGNVVAKQGAVSIKTDQLTAHYVESEAGEPQITRMEASGNVHIESPQGNLSGDLGSYEVASGHMKVTGKTVTFKGDGQTVVAHQRMEYFTKELRAVAVGNVLASLPEGRSVRGENITSFLHRVGDKTVPRRFEATGSVVIKSAQETATAERAVYEVDKELATLTGKVKVARGANEVMGERLEINMETGVSRMTGGTSRALIAPEKKPEKK